MASAMVNTSQQIGGAVGTAALSTIFTSALTRYVTQHQPPRPGIQAAAAIHGSVVRYQVFRSLIPQMLIPAANSCG